MTGAPELSVRFECFGSSCAAFVIGEGRGGSAREAVALVRRRLEGWHCDLSRFSPASELSRLNGDPRWEVPTSLMLALLAQSVRVAASLTGGLVDATLVDQIEAAGYGNDLGDPIPLSASLELAPPRKPAAAGSPAAWKSIEVNLTRRTVGRPPGVKIDSGGLAKGLFADVLAERLASHASFAVNCAGDLTIGGAQRIARPVEVESPFDGSVLHTFGLRRAGVATSGIGRRSWLDGEGHPAHHLLDPSTGRPAFTGIVQVTALAPSALIAEIQAKAAILSGPQRARAWLPSGGLIVFDNGSHEVIDPPDELTLGRRASYGPREAGSLVASF